MATRRRKTPGRLSVGGELWLTVGETELGGRDRMDLLAALAREGSITQAAKAVGLSYKAAWDAVDRMNQVAGEPLIERSVGGRGGGSTRLTERGARLVERYEQLQAVHRRFLELLDHTSIDLGQEFSLLKVINMKTSARNQFVGTVTAIKAGAVNDEVELTLPGGAKLAAIVTRDASESLGLRLNMTALALVQASSILLATGLEGARVSARNQLPGQVVQVNPGAVNAEVVLQIAGGGRVSSIVTQPSVQAMGLAPGVAAVALFKASSVILAVVS